MELILDSLLRLEENGGCEKPHSTTIPEDFCAYCGGFAVGAVKSDYGSFRPLSRSLVPAAGGEVD